MEVRDEAVENKCLFESQTEEEHLILLLRAHFVTNVPWIILTLLLAVVPILVSSFGFLDQLSLGLNISAQRIDDFILIWYLVVFAFAFQNFITWYFNVYILTDQRIVDFDFFQLLYKKISSAQLTNIEDITVSMGGVAQVLFNYGSINIQTAGEVPEFEFARVANPAEVKKAIEKALAGVKR